MVRTPVRPGFFVGITFLGKKLQTFAHAVMSLGTTLVPLELLEFCKKILKLRLCPKLSRTQCYDELVLSVSFIVYCYDELVPSVYFLVYCYDELVSSVFFIVYYPEK